MKKIFVLAVLALLGSINALAYDIEVKNADGVMIYYNYINEGRELAVTGGVYMYSGTVVIPEEVTFMNRTRKVTSIGERAFYECWPLTSVTIPNSVTSIGYQAFYDCDGLTSVTIPNSVTSIENNAFSDCGGLTSVTIGNGVTSIGEWAFSGCSSLTSVTIPNSVTSIGGGAFFYCSGLSSVTIPNSVTSIGNLAFYKCSGLSSVTIPNSVTSIGNNAFQGCSGLSSVTIPNSVMSIGGSAFYGCSGLTSVTIPNSVTSIGDYAFDGFDMKSVISLIEEPFTITGKSSDSRTFSRNTFNNATLYVPAGTIDKYKATNGWKDFLFIEEGDGGNPTPGPEPEEKVCAKPTIHYQNGKLTFQCATEGVEFISEITDSDIKKNYTASVDLGVTYHISVYATRAGYTNSEKATATLCWIDVEPQTEGITDGDENAVVNVKAMPVLIQQDGNYMTISGTPAGTPLRIYDLSGRLINATTATDGVTRVECNSSEKMIIVKVGERTVKVVMGRD